MKEKKYIIEGTQVQGLINYLAERPFKEVQQGIMALSSLQEYIDPKKEAKEAKKESKWAG